MGAVATFASIALLAPAASAAAPQSHHAYWCVDPLSGASVTLKPGERCTFFPLATIQFTAGWNVIKQGSGGICAGVTQYPPQSSNVPLDGYGRPTSWQCVPPNTFAQGIGGLQWDANGPFGAVGGQATILNFSTATITFIKPLTGITYYA
jgi:hypothetical protein